MLRAALIATTVLILGGPGAGRAQPQCLGDCNYDGVVAVAEIVSGVAIALQRKPISACVALDADDSLSVSISELTAAVGFALNGCPLPRCGDRSVMARFRACVRSQNPEDCEAAGGEWGPYPFSREPGCFCPTGQGDCPCTTGDDCLAFCTAPIPGDFSSCALVEMGTCGAMTPQAGCFCTPSFTAEPSFITLCVDP